MNQKEKEERRRKTIEALRNLNDNPTPDMVFNLQQARKEGYKKKGRDK